MLIKSERKLTGYNKSWKSVTNPIHFSNSFAPPKVRYEICLKFAMTEFVRNMTVTFIFG